MTAAIIKLEDVRKARAGTCPDDCAARWSPARTIGPARGALECPIRAAQGRWDLPCMPTMAEVIRRPAASPPSVTTGAQRAPEEGASL